MGKIAIRWIYEACYEIVTPEGEHIVIDPDISIHKLPGFSAEDFERVDYLACTHTHFDHTSDIGYLSEKFQPVLMLGELSAMSLARFFDLSFGKLYPVGNGDILDFGKVKFQFVRGKHTMIPDPKRGRPKSTLQTTITRFGIDGHGESDQFGWLESYHILITLSDNTRIMMLSGLLTNQEIYRIAEEFRPNILIRQSCTPDIPQYAKECTRIGGSIILPHHHEKVTDRWKMPVEDIQRTVNEELRKLGSGAQFVMPEQFKWYEIGMEMKQK